MGAAYRLSLQPGSSAYDHAYVGIYPSPSSKNVSLGSPSGSPGPISLRTRTKRSGSMLVWGTAWRIISLASTGSPIRPALMGSSSARSS